MLLGGRLRMAYQGVCGCWWSSILNWIVVKRDKRAREREREWRVHVVDWYLFRNGVCFCNDIRETNYIYIFYIWLRFPSYIMPFLLVSMICHGRASLTADAIILLLISAMIIIIKVYAFPLTSLVILTTTIALAVIIHIINNIRHQSSYSRYINPLKRLTSLPAPRSSAKFRLFDFNYFLTAFSWDPDNHIT